MVFTGDVPGPIVFQIAGLEKGSLFGPPFGTGCRPTRCFLEACSKLQERIKFFACLNPLVGFFQREPNAHD
jgi:hypothetical protein